MAKSVNEVRRDSLPGIFILCVILAFGAISIWQMISSIAGEDGFGVFIWIVVMCLTVFASIGLFMVQPNQGVVLQLFGAYVGTAKTPGLRYANPFYSKTKVSLRARNFETGKLKVNDLDGNPVEIAAVVVWKVVDTAEACFMVDDYENYIHIQSEAAVRNLTTEYSYDTFGDDEDEASLRGSTATIAERLKAEIQDRLSVAGIEVIEARISHLAYASEIAAAMLQRQQATAIIAARHKIVDGAVGMVEMALERLEKENILQFDEERKAAMVSNLLVVLCGDRSAQPVLNTGTIHH